MDLYQLSFSDDRQKGRGSIWERTWERTRRIEGNTTHSDYTVLIKNSCLIKEGGGGADAWGENIVVFQNFQNEIRSVSK